MGRKNLAGRPGDRGEREGQFRPDLIGFFNIMKAEYLKVFAPAVLAKMASADAIGSKTSWATSDHLAALAKLITSKSEAEALDILQACYNVSAFQQTLAKAYKSTGHFQRDSAKGLSSVIASLHAAVESAKQG